MMAQVTSVFMYVDNVEKSVGFYNEIVGAEIHQIHYVEKEGGPISLAMNFDLSASTIAISPSRSGSVA